MFNTTSSTWRTAPRKSCLKITREKRVESFNCYSKRCHGVQNVTKIRVHFGDAVKKKWSTKVVQSSNRFGKNKKWKARENTGFRCICRSWNRNSYLRREHEVLRERESANLEIKYTITRPKEKRGQTSNTASAFYIFANASNAKLAECLVGYYNWARYHSSRDQNIHSAQKSPTLDPSMDSNIQKISSIMQSQN